jgi:hypothetical protein
MMQIKDEVFRVDKIVAVLEELTGFILREILEASSTMMAIWSLENLHRRRERLRTCNPNENDCW